MIDVRQTDEFKAWIEALRDERAAKKIAQRIVRVASGLLGDVKFFDGIGEMRVDFGPGYRVYFVKRGETLIILLCGGDKSSQDRDIKKALKMAEEV
ncbi:type II toxin-antitoxin system RelE/ParE family toxin [Xanthobacter aminoxidans]|uniref:Type II toxin-antitoxin system RelE/ParE family toxin n=1 Tax=Xanthobacter aminoxidans TaxID=186280 RepID=A0ABW6ZA41_9HYPH